MTLKVSKNMTGPVGPFTGGIVPDGSTIDTSLQLIITNLIGKESALPTGGLTTQYLRGDKTWASFTKATVGLANVDNTSDANKPVSSAVATALATKEDSLGASTAGYFLRGDRTWQVIGKATVGLANVDNTTDLNKPISTATQTALDGKASTAVVTTTVNGLMAFADKVKLNAIASGATANATDAALRDRSTHTGTQTADTIVETTSIKMMTAAERTKLSGIAASATANDTDVNLKNRANHTGTQAISTITNLQSSLDAKEGTIAAGTTAQFYRGDKTWVSLTKAIVGLANVDNTADIDKPISTAAQAALDLKAGTAVVTTTVNGLMAFTDKVKLDGIATGATANATDAALRARSSHTGTQAISTVTNLQTTLDGKESLANKGVVNGYAPLGADGKVPSINLPDNGSYKGNWNASTNTPTIVAGTGTNGDTYTVSVAGTQSVTGTSTAFAVGDQLKYTTNGNKWERIPNTQAVSSVAGLAGTIAASDLKTALTLAKSDVGLSNVDNTADSAKPISTAAQAALDGKEPTIAAGTTSNFWRGDKTWVTITKTTVGLANVDNTSDANKPISTATQTALNAKASTAVATTTVDGLMAFADKAKLNGIATGATANDTDANLKNRSNHTGTQAISTVTGLQAALDGKAPTSLVTTATDGLMAYGDKIKLDGIATSATANATDAALRDRATHTGAQAISTITNLQSTLDGKESTVPAGTTSQFYRGDKTWVAITKSTVGLSNVDNTSDATKPISTATQTALDNKASTAVVTTTVNGLMAFADKVKLNGIATGATANDTDANLKARENHTGAQAISTVTGLQTALDGKEPSVTAGTTSQFYRGDKTWVALTKTTVGLSNVDNTSDASKPISTAMQTALNAKASLASPTFTGTVGGITKAMVGLDSVNNTADIDKPVSTATATAISDAVASLRSTEYPFTVASGTQSSFVLPVTLTAAPEVFLNGIRVDATGFTWSGNTVTFNAPVSAVSLVSILTITGQVQTTVNLANVIGLSNATTTTAGLLSAADKTTINNLPSLLDAKAGTSVVTTSANGLMSATDKVKLNGIATGATINSTDAQLRDRSTHTGTQTADTIVETASVKMMSSAERTKLSGIATAATANDTDANLKNRSNHTGTQAISTIVNLQTTLDAKAPLASPDFSGTPTIGGSVIENRASRGVANGYAPLGADGKVPSANLPDNGSYKGNWNANTNTPAITAGTGNNGDTYTVSVAGTQSVTGSSVAFAVGDQLKFTTNGNKWERIPNTQAVSSVAGLTGTISPTDLKTAIAVTKSDVGLGSVDNTSDANKPISTAVSTALATKASTDVVTTTVNGLMSSTMLTKLNGIATGATANSTDASLRDRGTHTGTQAVSTITGLQDALDGLEPAVSSSTTGRYYRGDKTWQALNKSAVGLANVDNTTDADKPLSTAATTALALKAPLASPVFTGTPTSSAPAITDYSARLATTKFVKDLIQDQEAKGGSVNLTRFNPPMNGVDDDGPAIRAALAWMKANDVNVLNLPAKPLCIASEVLISGFAPIIRGSGFIEGPNYADDKGTRIKANTIGFNAFKLTGFASRGTVITNISFYQDQPTVTTGWKPMNDGTSNEYQPIIYLFEQYGGAILDQLYFCNVSRAIKSLTCGRVNIGTISGQVFNYMVDIDNALDVFRIDHVHCWTFWTTLPEVMVYQGNNLDCIRVGRADGLHVGEMFSLQSRSVFYFYKSSFGSTTSFVIDQLYTDFSLYAIWADGDGTAGHIGYLKAQGQEFPAQTPRANSFGLYITKPNTTLTFGYMRVHDAGGGAIKLGPQATGHFVEIGTSWFYSINQDNSHPVIEADPLATGSITFHSNPRIYDSNNPLLVNANASTEIRAPARALLSSNGVNYARTYEGAPGVGPSIRAEGSDTNVDLVAHAKGPSGSVRLAANNKIVFRADDNSGDSTMLVRSNMAGIDMIAESGSTNASITLSPKGTGILQYNRPSKSSGRIHAIRTVTASGNITVVDTDEFIIVNKTVAQATNVILPAAPTVGFYLTIKDGKGDAVSNNITVTPAAGNIAGKANYVINTSGGLVRLVFNGTSWIIVESADYQVEHYTPQMFGAVGDGVTDDAPAFQKALDFLATVKNGGRLWVPSPSGTYRWNSPVVWRSQCALSIVGEASASVPYAYEGLATIVYYGAAGTTALLAETSGNSVAAPGRGIELENLLIYRPTTETKANNGTGIAFKGITRGKMINCVVYGFANGITLDDNPLNAGSNSVRTGHILLDNCDVYMAANYRLSIKGCAEITVRFCNLQADMVPSYTGGVYVGPGTNGGRCDAIFFEKCIIIGGTDVYSEFPTYGVLIEDAIWVVFSECNIERARVSGIRVIYSEAYKALSTFAGDYGAITIENCFFDAMAGSAIDIYGARVTIRNNRYQQLDPNWNNWGGTVTSPIIKIRGGTGTEIPAYGSVIEGGVMFYEGASGIDINYAACISIRDIYATDKVAWRQQAAGETVTPRPQVRLGANTTRCLVSYPQGAGYEAPPTNLGTGNIVQTFS